VAAFIAGIAARRAPHPDLRDRTAISYATHVPTSLPPQDQTLVQIVDAALADAARRSGEWLICRPGCTPCCIGVFTIDQLDVRRLQNGMTALETADPQRAARVRQRAQASVARISPEFPGDLETGLLGDDEEAAERFETFADHEPCPALDPEHGTCDLYESRPMTCRVFGPPIRSEGGLGVCELCYHGASPEQVAACEMELSEADALQSELLGALSKTGDTDRTIVSFALAQEPAGSGLNDE
jgi:Fe-S-cluster containining protein